MQKMQFLFFKTLIFWITLFIHGFNCISFSIFLWKWKTNESKNLLNLKMRVNYLNFVFRNEVKTKSKYRILNFVFQFIKNTKWHFGYTDWGGWESENIKKENHDGFLSPCTKVINGSEKYVTQIFILNKVGVLKENLYFTLFKLQYNSRKIWKYAH